LSSSEGVACESVRRVEDGAGLEKGDTRQRKLRSAIPAWANGGQREWSLIGLGVGFGEFKKIATFGLERDWM